MVNERFGRWIVLEELPMTRSNRKKVYLCQCSCGTRRNVVGGNLRSGISRSCGCYKSEVTSKTKFKHGRGTSNKTYRIWSAMRARCQNDKSSKFHRYGGRGIKVCRRWDDFNIFLADMGEVPKGMSIDRIDNDGDYTPDNCRWATIYTQSRNKSDNVWLKHRGRRMILSDWAREIGVEPSVLTKRLKRGWSVEKTLKEVAA